MTPITAVFKQKQFSQSRRSKTTTASAIAVQANRTEQSVRVRRAVLVVSLAARRMEVSQRRKRRRRTKRRRKKRRRKMWLKIKNRALPSSDRRLLNCRIQHRSQHCINFIKCKMACLMERSNNIMESSSAINLSPSHICIMPRATMVLVSL